jgi:hypothetical protein
VDGRDQQDEYEGEETERRNAIYGNSEARSIVDAAFREADMPIEAYGEVYFAVLERVDARLTDGTPSKEIPSPAALWLREELARPL